MMCAGYAMIQQYETTKIKTQATKTIHYHNNLKRRRNQS